VTPFDGDLDDYRKLLLSRGRDSGGKVRGAEKATAKSDSRRDSAGRRKQLKPLKDRADAAEKEIAKLMADIAKIDAALTDLFRREPTKAAALSKQRADLGHILAAAEDRWLAASNAYEEALGND